jgi:hypothetical protein
VAKYFFWLFDKENDKGGESWLQPFSSSSSIKYIASLSFRELLVRAMSSQEKEFFFVSPIINFC